MLAFFECLFDPGTLLNALHVSFFLKTIQHYIYFKKKGCHCLDNAQCHIVSEVQVLTIFTAVFIDH